MGLLDELTGGGDRQADFQDFIGALGGGGLGALAGQNPAMLAGLLGQMHRQDPGMLGGLLGGLGGGAGGLLSGGSKGALAGIAAMAAKRLIG